MPEHAIRLRRAWLVQEMESEQEPPRPIDLPVLWPPNLVRALRLTRSFGRPELGSGSGLRLALRLEAVTGLLAVVLNGRSLGSVDPFQSRVEFSLDDSLLARNVLKLDVDTGLARREELWGMVSLVIEWT